MSETLEKANKALSSPLTGLSLPGRKLLSWAEVRISPSLALSAAPTPTRNTRRCCLHEPFHFASRVFLPCSACSFSLSNPHQIQRSGYTQNYTAKKSGPSPGLWRDTSLLGPELSSTSYLLLAPPVLKAQTVSVLSNSHLTFPGFGHFAI